MDKQEKIVSMFNNIASTYDRANHILSMGIDTIWRKKACDHAFNYYDHREITKVIDVACGTGDMMATWEKRANAHGIIIHEIVGVDPSEGMVAVGREKLPHLNFEIAGAAQMPFEDNSADIISITYGIRNVVDREEALQEFHRILKPGGLVVILEFTKSEKQGWMHSIRDFYMNKVLPKIGGFISKDQEAYTYLPDSIEDFLTTKKLVGELKQTGFKSLHVQSYSMEISTLFIAQK
jgi:demethylmenaquinone methyltransferase/2-methoxy-6-polyprenyl-1,4-benzoquinol methylase